MTILIIFTSLVTFTSGSIIHLGEDDYNRMPPLLELDNYHQCIQNEGIYCEVVFSLVSEEPSDLLTMIQEYSAFTNKHFNHSIIHRGICVTDTCKDLLQNSDVDLKYTLEACLNRTMWERYQLKTRLRDGYNCNVHKKKFDRNIADTLVAIICMLVLLANIVASLWDYFYPHRVNNKAAKMLLCFSIMRNWRHLTAPASKDMDPRLAKLQCLHGFRAITMCLVIIVHSLLPCLIFVENPQYVESELYENPLVKLFLNGTHTIQTFFIMSGFLLAYNSLLQEEKKASTWPMIPKYLLKRFIRLTAPYALMLGLTATWFRYLSYGPLWQKLTGKEAEDCRRHWWRHLLYINNYYDNSECMLQMWYLGADMQLATLGVVLYFICKNHRIRRILLPTLIAVGAIIPGLHAYFQDLDATMVLNPESIISIFGSNVMFNEIYKRGHTNLNGYIVGISMGYLMYHWDKIGVKPEKYYKYRFLYRSLWLLAVGLLFTGAIFYEDRPRDPIFVRVLYPIVVKPFFVLLIAGTMAGTIFGVESLYRGILEWRYWVYLSKVSYSAYLCHVAYIRATATAITTLAPLNFLVIIQCAVQSLVVCLLLGLMFWILVEAPVGGLIKICTRPAVQLEYKSVKINGHSANGFSNESTAKTKNE